MNDVAWMQRETVAWAQLSEFVGWVQRSVTQQGVAPALFYRAVAPRA
jgi:hypothetical protein